MNKDDTDVFAIRLEQMHTARRRDCPTSEIDAAVMIRERLITAKSICQSHFGAKFSQSALLAVFAELCAEARKGQGNTSLE